MTDGPHPAIAGLALGLIASVVSTRLIRSRLYGTDPLDPAVFVLVSVGLLVVATLACFLPACHAARIDLMQALRME